MSCIHDSHGHKPSFEIGDIFRDNIDKLHCCDPDQWKVTDALISCKTAALGGHVFECDSCHHTTNSYNSCRNRHCPKCQTKAQAQWLEKEVDELLPVEYFHVVFTIPSVLNAVASANKRAVYAILFRAVKETLLESAGNPKNLGARIGFLAILHTWGQNLLDHPHIHCVVPGGGLSADKSSWISCARGFFVHVNILSRLFKGKVLDYLKKAYQEGKISFHSTEDTSTPASAFQRVIDQAYAKEWVVYAKKPFAGPQQVLRYLGRYTHRIAISNYRIVDVRDDKVVFKWKDYRDGNKTKLMTLSTSEFLRRFLLHVIPRNFVRIRSYGLLSNRTKATMLGWCRALLNSRSADTQTATEQQDQRSDEPHSSSDDTPLFLCPKCRRGHMIAVGIIEPARINPAILNTS